MKKIIKVLTYSILIFIISGCNKKTEQSHIHKYHEIVTNPTCEERGYTLYMCDCGYNYIDNYVDELGHHYEEVNFESTCFSHGITLFLCKCGNNYFSDSTDIIEHEYDENGNCYICQTNIDSNYTILETYDFTDVSVNKPNELLINSNLNRIMLIGDPSIVYTNFNIKVLSRSSNLCIFLKNFNYIANNEEIGLDCRDVPAGVEVMLLADGMSSIVGGQGKNGSKGTSYNYNNGAKYPGDGQDGYDGNDGAEGVVGNNIILFTNEDSSLIISGGSGGNGGSGGEGEGAACEGIGQAGHAGNGGNGGNGATGLKIGKSLRIVNNGTINLIGGSGGNGGKGGHGGENTNTGTFDRADNAGNGGSGGNGGAGGYGVYLADEAKSVEVVKNLICCQSGAGGNGGNGGAGGSSCKNAFQSGNGGKAGNGGNGGNGGNYTNGIYNFAEECIINEVSGGLGGSGGKKGTCPNYSSYDGKKGYDGKIF